MAATPHLQTIVDLAFFIIIAILLWRLDRRIAKADTREAATVLAECQRAIDESRELARGFLEQVEASQSAIRELASRLAEKDRKVHQQLAAADQWVRQIDALIESPSPPASPRRYEEVARLAAQGLNHHEISRLSGVMAGEIALVSELARARTAHR